MQRFSPWMKAQVSHSNAIEFGNANAFSEVGMHFSKISERTVQEDQDDPVLDT